MQTNFCADSVAACFVGVSEGQPESGDRGHKHEADGVYLPLPRLSRAGQGQGQFHHRRYVHANSHCATW